MKKLLFILLLFIMPMVVKAGTYENAIDNIAYVQHDASNNNVYELVKGTNGTVVYKNIYATFTASKAWTVTGRYVDNSMSEPVGATAPNNYIPVKEGEKYFVKMYGVGGEYAPILFMDNSNNMVGSALTSTYSKSKSGVEITVPKNATKMHITYYNNQSFTLQQVLTLTDAEFNKINVTQNEIMNYINSSYNNYTSNKEYYNSFKKAYITFVVDDTRAGINVSADLFEQKNVPLCLATIPSLLIENSGNGYETRKQVADRVVRNGGEILAHAGTTITNDNYNDYNTMYSVFIRNKQILKQYGYDVNGIMLSGGGGQIYNATTEKWAQAFFDYSDRYGVVSDYLSYGYQSVYYYPRTGINKYTYETLKQDIDDAINRKKWIIIYWHDLTEAEKTLVTQILDYINTKSTDEIEVVTYKDIYDEYYVTKNSLKNDNKTYYVSSTGTGDGLSESNPMSLEVAKSKKYTSGDKILLKGGDTFYGNLDFYTVSLDSDITTIGSYGNGKAIISGAKIVNNTWELYSTGVYRVNLKDTTKFSGIQTTDQNSTNIGFLEDKTGKKYYNKVNSLSSLKNEYDFYCDGTYIYFKSSTNPYQKLGSLKLATRIKLITLKSNLIIDNLNVTYTGGHAIATSGYDDITNVTIKNCIIENIGGSYLKGTTRYGNGVQFYGVNTSNIVVTNNIFRDIYDVAFTIQGERGSGYNINVYNNVMVNNSQDSEIWENGTSTGVRKYIYSSNISINQGRGWGYEARSNKYCAGAILFWGYLLTNTDINFNDNLFYNPKRIYFIEGKYGTIDIFKNNNYIKSDNNVFYLGTDSILFREEGNINTVNILKDTYNKDKNSSFYLLDKTELSNITSLSSTSNSINEIRNLFKSKLIEKIEVSSLPKKINYIINEESLNLSSGKLKVSYKVMLDEVIDLSNNMVSNFTNKNLGKLSLKVSYLNKTTYFDINIVNKPVEIKETTQIIDNNSNEIDDTSSNSNNNVTNDTKPFINIDISVPFKILYKENTETNTIEETSVPFTQIDISKSFKVLHKEIAISSDETKLDNQEQNIQYIEPSIDTNDINNGPLEFIFDFVEKNGISVYMIFALVVVTGFIRIMS